MSEFWNPPPHSRRHQHFIIPNPTSSKTFCSIFKVNGKSSAEHSNTVAPTARQRGVELYQPRERSILTKSAMRRKSTRTWHAAGLGGRGGGVLVSPRPPEAHSRPGAAGWRCAPPQESAPLGCLLRVGAAPGSALATRRGVLLPASRT